MEIKCEICGKICKNEPGYKSHMRMKHKIFDTTLPIEYQESIRKYTIDEMDFEDDSNVEGYDALTDTYPDDNDIKEDVLVEDVEVESEEDVINKEIIDWYNRLKGRTTANRFELERMFGWFLFVYPDSKLTFNYSCTSCCTTVFNRLKQYYNKIKNNYN